MISIWSRLVTPQPGDMSMDRAVEALVANALDDLEQEFVDVATALRLVARLAWSFGYHSAAAGNSDAGESGDCGS
jgi:hypothetical protein